MKNKLLFIVCSVLFTGCQFTDQNAYQQQQVCKRLAEGYLTTQNQQSYEFWKLEQAPTHEQQSTLKLTYKKPNENGLILSGVYLPTVELECTLKNQQIMVSVIQAKGALVPVLNVQLQNEAIGKPKSPDLIAQSKTQ
ncbi:hypothetical protein EXE30_00135 [Acinetobacter halotolerans]|uniref:Lipoprotein n=1 Tax=Acinetobacter halotolerans TaxID=1752076 RepID=A0A4Q6XMT7_9GAMM|nr:hypothetical protein [Acinetobacter halotolerans]RZF56704.1 hypothetical protein EXE30_00135 [Acinetobacter halotolerans]